MKLLKIAFVSLLSLSASAITNAATVCPALTGASSAYYAGIPAAGSNCNVVITINADLTQTVAIVNSNPYDGNDDNYVGVINNSAGSVSSIDLSANTDIFAFDGDGIDGYGISGNTIDTTQYGGGAYGGTDAYFTGINSSNSSGTINFIGGIDGGGTGYFSLEEAPTASSLTPGPINTTVTPEPSSLVLLGTGVLTFAGVVRRRFLQ